MAGPNPKWRSHTVGPKIGAQAEQSNACTEQSLPGVMLRAVLAWSKETANDAAFSRCGASRAAQRRQPADSPTPGCAGTAPDDEVEGLRLLHQRGLKPGQRSRSVLSRASFGIRFARAVSGDKHSFPGRAGGSSAGISVIPRAAAWPTLPSPGWAATTNAGATPAGSGICQFTQGLHQRGAIHRGLQAINRSFLRRIA